jgi:hypothetical protein
MIYRLLAEAVLMLHLGFVLFAVFGGVLVVRRHGWRLLHLPAVAWAGLVQIAGWTCPLTPLENHFRRLGGDAGYGGGFVEHYLLSALYPSGLTREIQIVLGVLVVTVNIVVYVTVSRRRRSTGRTAAAETIRAGEAD